jgi:hypothetical protein
MTDKIGSNDWRALCELARKEEDPGKLLKLIVKINRALEQCNRASGQRSALVIESVVLPLGSVVEQPCSHQSEFDSHRVALQLPAIGDEC